jgi:hypothetical protein
MRFARMDPDGPVCINECRSVGKSKPQNPNLSACILVVQAGRRSWSVNVDRTFTGSKIAFYFPKENIAFIINALHTLMHVENAQRRKR